MSERLSEIRTHIDNIRQLGAAVGAMRVIAASRAQQSREKIAGVEAHAAIVARGLGEALLMAPGAEPTTASRESSAGKALIVFCGEAGFCGGLSDRVLNVTARETGDVFAIGTRGAGLAEERGLRPVWTARMPTQLGAVPTVSMRVADALYDAIAKGKYDRVEMIYPRVRSAGALSIERVLLLPLDLQHFRLAEDAEPPLHNLPVPLLIEQLAEEYVSALLYRAVLQSFIAENEARMMAMTAARDHIDSLLSDLTLREHQARQEEITDEVVELSAATADIRAP